MFERQQPNTSDYRDLIGGTALQLVTNLRQLLQPPTDLAFEKFYFKTYYSSPTLAERVNASTKDSHHEVFEKADQLRQTWRKLANTDLPYWFSIFSATTTLAESEVFLEEALMHDASGQRHEMSVAALTEETLQAFIEGLPPATLVSLLSKCKLGDGSIAHIPMLDFHDEPSERNLARVKSALKKLGQKRGAILESGRSYHFYGFDLLDDERWMEFMAKSLLLAPLTDLRFLAHRLLEVTGSLRITSSEAKPKVPMVVDVL
ncbi:MAG TPA: hypothetical protein VIW64_09430 [Pyrinomonadaceae bacterium]|jgi:hypothetical protein